MTTLQQQQQRPKQQQFCESRSAASASCAVESLGDRVALGNKKIKSVFFGTRHTLLRRAASAFAVFQSDFVLAYNVRFHAANIISVIWCNNHFYVRNSEMVFDVCRYILTLRRREPATHFFGISIFCSAHFVHAQFFPRLLPLPVLDDSIQPSSFIAPAHDYIDGN